MPSEKQPYFMRRRRKLRLVCALVQYDIKRLFTAKNDLMNLYFLFTVKTKDLPADCTHASNHGNGPFSCDHTQINIIPLAGAKHCECYLKITCSRGTCFHISSFDKIDNFSQTGQRILGLDQMFGVLCKQCRPS